MRILMISPQFKPIVGGYERACERLAGALSASGNNVSVCAERRDKKWPTREAVGGVQLYRWWCIYKPGWHVITSLLGLAGFLLRHGRAFQVWHVHQYGAHAALAVVMGALLRRRVVLKLTNSSDMGLAQALATGRFPRFMAALHRRVDAVVALTRETADEAEAFGIHQARIHILGNGVDTQEFRPLHEAEGSRLKQRLGLGDGPVVIFVGRLSEEKNVAGLLNAWAKARPEMEGDWKLVVVGDGPLRTELEAMAYELSLGTSVHFVGQQANVADWLAAANVYVLASQNEGLSNTLLEAMATALPVVTTRVSGMQELVEMTGSGCVVPVGDMAALADALVKLSASVSLHRETGTKARQVIEERFAIDYVASIHEKLYAGLLRNFEPDTHIQKESH